MVQKKYKLKNILSSKKDKKPKTCVLSSQNDTKKSVAGNEPKSKSVEMTEVPSKSISKHSDLDEIEDYLN